MKHSIIAFLFAILAVALGAPAAMAQAPERGRPSAELQNFVRDSYIFKLADSVSRGRIPARASALVGQASGRLGFTYSTAFRGFSARMTSVAADNLFRNNDDVIGYNRDGIVTIEASSQGNKNGKGKNPFGGGGSTGEIVPWGVARVGGAGDGTGDGTGTAWIIDTGIDLDHPDLYVDVDRSQSFLSTGKDPKNPNDEHGHGTHVAGTIAAIDNEIDVVGVAAGATVVAVRVLNKRGSGTWSGVIAGIDYVAANGASGDVANMSLGGSYNQAVNDAVVAASGKVMFSLAAGNESTDAGTRSPASANGINIYTVSAIDKNDGFASFSNYGNPPVDFAAPGVNVESLAIGGGVSTKSGTSMAAPHVAGILLLGDMSTDGEAGNDPDGNSDPIAQH